jgi:hypothetical protein
MRARVKLTGFLFAALLVASFFAWPSAAAAQENPQVRGNDLLFPRGFDPLIDKAYYGAEAAKSLSLQGTAGTSKAFSRLAVRLYGGLSRIAAGDINAGCDGYFELIAQYVAEGSGTMTGEYSPLHWGADFGGDIIFQLSPNIGIGVGAGYMRYREGSEMTYTETEPVTLTAAPTVSAVPIRLGVFLTFPVAKKFNVTANVGGAYYAGLKFDAWQRVAFTADEWYQNAVSASRSSGNLGFQGGLGLEYMFTPKMGFFVEAVGRYARFKNFAVATGTNTDSGGESETIDGKIYIVDYSFGTITFDWISVSETEPVIGGEITGFHEPKFDLSGFSLQAGIRIRL